MYTFPTHTPRETLYDLTSTISLLDGDDAFPAHSEGLILIMINDRQNTHKKKLKIICKISSILHQA